MIRLLIVDDEPLIRLGIKASVTEFSDFIEIVGDEYNGVGALEFLRSHEDLVDCILTDIKMPGMDGIELIKIVRKEFPQIKTIALSSYNDIVYVREAMKNGAMDYLLKHEIDGNNLAEKILALFYQEEFTDNKKNEIISTDTKKDAIKAAFMGRKFLYDLETRSAKVVFVIKIRQMSDDTMFEDGQLFSTMVVNLLEQHLKNKIYQGIIHIKDHLYAGLLDVDENEIYENDLEFCGLLMKKYLNLLVSIGVSAPFENKESIAGAFKQAEEALETSFFAKTNEYYYCEYLMLRNNDAKSALEKHIFKTAEALKDVDDKQIKRILKQAFRDLLMIRGSSREEITMAAEYFMIEVLEKAKVSSYYDKKKLSVLPDDYNIYDLWGVIENNLEYVKKMKHTSKKSSVKTKVLTYINDNYGKADMSLSKLSEHMNLSVPYLSRLFKEKFGMGFSEYLIQLRINRAIELIEEDQDISLQEVSFAVGIDNYNHFSKTFKKITGISPSEYRTKRNI